MFIFRYSQEMSEKNRYDRPPSYTSSNSRGEQFTFLHLANCHLHLQFCVLHFVFFIFCILHSVFCNLHFEFFVLRFCIFYSFWHFVFIICILPFTFLYFEQLNFGDFLFFLLESLRTHVAS